MKKLQSALLAKSINVSDMTISRLLTYDIRLKLRKPSLTKSMKAKSIAFAKAHQHWTTEH